MKKFYITTTIPYVNAEPHIGHALEFIQADTLARFRRLEGDEVYFLSGSDENAIKNVQAAEKAGVPVKEWVARNAQAFEELLEAFGIGIDQFIRTTEERHIKGAQALWSATNPKDIYKKKYEGLYCVGCEQFYKPEELDEKGECFEHPGKKPEVVEEENYFFRLSSYGPWLRDLLASGALKLVPESRKNELLSLIDQGLEDFSISRPATRSKGWGVPVPEDPSQTIYVWYDALANYITALGYPNAEAPLYKKFWAEGDTRFHILGKGVSRFHAIYWPAMLKSAGLVLPNEEFIHGYITIEGKKISKTLGNVVDSLAMAKKYGVDAVRYYLLREIPTADDGDFSEEKLLRRYNSDLANGLGNFVARVLTLVEKRGGDISHEDADQGVKSEIAKTKTTIQKKMGEYRFHEALQSIWELLAWGDAYVNEKKPWEAGEHTATLTNLYAIVKALGEFVEPFIPSTSQAIKLQVEAKKKGDSLFPRLS